ncbi:MAG: ATP-binding protein [Armatimonadota bacterium]|nr:ATP-binding protein [Armatimonadota bacterium]MDR7465411.1 ATP-binding protein [Armatimonadota bacterium]
MRSIRFKLIATYVALAAVVLVVVTAVMLAALHRRYLETYQYMMATQARLIASMLFAYFREEPLPREEMEAIAQRFRWRPETRIAVLDARGVHPAAPGAPPPPEVAAALAGREGRSVRYDPASGQERVFAAAPIGSEGAWVGVVHVSMPAVWAWRQLQRVLPAFGGALLLGLAAAWFVGARLARNLTDPVEALTRAAQRLREGELDATVEVRTRDEIGRLGEAFSTMAVRLRETIRRLVEERHTLEAILTGMVDAVVAIDRRERVILVNLAAEELLGVRREEVIGRPAGGVLPRALHGLVQEAAARRHAVAAELPGEGGGRLVEVRCAPIRGNGEVAGTVAVLRDVTELRRSERLRRELTANVSHELRTPLTSIKGFTETLLAGAMGDQAAGRRFLEIINAEADRLVKLVDDLMDLGRLEARGVALELAPVSVPALVEEMVAHLRPLAGGRRLEVRSGPPGAVVLGDRNRLAQVLTNLIDNAIKFTGEQGRVEVGWQEQDGSVQITVRDDGRGIPPADLPHIFERFYKADRSRGTSGGSGLGLAITKHIVEAHGGHILVESEEGRGTTFTVMLPKPENGQAA